MRSLFTKLAQNWQLKLAAFALAVLLWVALSARQTSSQWLPVPVEVQLHDPAFELAQGPFPEEVEVRFTGPGRDLWQLVANRPPLVLRVPDVGDESEIFVLTSEMVRVPSGLTVFAQDVRPSSVRLNFSRLESREVPVAVQVSRGPREQHTLATPLRVRPARVRISGPAGRVREIDSIRTRPLDLSREDSAFVRSVVLDTARLRGLRLSLPEVEVSGRVDSVESRVIRGVVVQTPSGTTATPARVELELRGASSVLRRLGAASLRVSVPTGSDLADVPPGGLVLPVRIEQLPTGVQAQINPGSVRVFPAPPAPEVVPAPLLDTVRDTTAAPGGTGRDA